MTTAFRERRKGPSPQLRTTPARLPPPPVRRRRPAGAAGPACPTSERRTCPPLPADVMREPPPPDLNQWPPPHQPER